MSFHFFERSELQERGAALAQAFASAKPFRHVVVDDFLPAAVAKQLAQSFPTADDGFRKLDYAEQKRMTQLGRTGFATLRPELRHLLNELCGMAMLDFLFEVSRIEGLIADPHYSGAGPHRVESGGFLAVHTDFNHDRRRALERRLTTVLFLVEDWQEDWGGQLELWNRDSLGVSISPKQGRLVVFEHGETYWHGHPHPLTTPAGIARQTIASYYYTSPAKLSGSHSARWLKDEFE